MKIFYSMKCFCVLGLKIVDYTKFSTSTCNRFVSSLSILNKSNNGKVFSSKFGLNKHVRNIKFFSTEGNQNKEDNKILVYTGPLRKQIKIIKMFSLSTSAIGIAIQPSIVYSIAQSNMIIGVMTAFITSLYFSTPFLLQWITKRYVIELYFDKETEVFTAKTLTLFNKVKELNFKAEDVTVPALPGILSSFHVKDLPLFVDGRLVYDPDAYAHMMGLDKPIELIIAEANDEKK